MKMKSNEILVLSLLLFFACCSVSDGTGQYAHETILDHDNNVRLNWNVKDNKYIQFKMTLLNQKFPSIIGFGNLIRSIIRRFP